MERIILKISNVGKEFENTGSRQMRLLIGGSPCTHWSIAQKNNRETEPNGLGWELFKNFLIAKEKFKPDYFLYENNKSAAQPIKDQISKELGVPLQYINSALVSAQNRQRFYAHNIPNVSQPDDRGILLKDILESGTDLSQNEKSYSLTTRGQGGGAKTGLYACPIEPLLPFTEQALCETAEKYGYLPEMANPYNRAEITDKSPTITACSNRQSNSGQVMRVCPINIETEELDSEYYKGNQDSNVFGKIVSKNTSNNNGQPAQCVRIYKTDNKSICLDGDGRKYIIDRFDERFCSMNKPITIYKVQNGLITIKDKQYPIKLPDGYYIIRKLTVLECKRLQTVRDNYIMPCSASQNYKLLGNGWTVDVIAHILSHIPDIENCEVEVLSMYDGMSCGNLALEKLGCKINKYISYGIDKYAIQTTQTNFPYVIQKGDAFQVRNYNWKY